MVRAFVHTAWATVLLFGTKGNTRASDSGTAIVQSRFVLYLSGNTDAGYRFFVMSHGYREPILSKRGKTCEAVRAGKQLNYLTK